MSTFERDKERGTIAEHLVARIFRALCREQGHTFDVVGAQPQYHHIGDILCHTKSGNELIFEVKDDAVIASSHNVLCEISTTFNDTNATRIGNMYNPADYYCVLSQSEQKLYIFSHRGLRDIMAQYKKIFIHNQESSTEAYLVPLEEANKKSVWLFTIYYGGKTLKIEGMGW